MNAKKLLALLMVLIMVFSLMACGKTDTPDAPNTPDTPDTPDTPNAEVDTDPFGAYDKTVTVTIGMPMSTGAFADGVSTMMDNTYKTYINETLNADYTFFWEDKDAASYEEIVDMAKVSGELPDFFICQKTDVDDFVKMGLVQDLTEVWDQYATDELKSLYASYMDAYGQDPLGQVTYDGKLMAIPHTSAGGNNSACGVWIRQDWLEKLNLDPDPDGNRMLSLDDLEMVAQAFVDNDPGNSGNPEGFCMLPWIGLGSYMSPGIVNRAYGVRHLNWFKDENGDVYYGSFSEDAKTALAWWNEMYEKGLVDPDFISTQFSNESLGATWSTNRCGIITAMENGPEAFFSIAYEASPEARFTCYGFERPSDGLVAGYTQSDDIGYAMCVSKDCKNPELLIKFLNIRERVNNDADLYRQLCGTNGTPISMGPVCVSDTEANWMGIAYQYAVDFMEGKITLDEVPPRYTAYMDVIAKYMEDPTSLNVAERARFDSITQGFAFADAMVKQDKLYNEFDNIILNMADISPTYAERFMAELYPLEEEYTMKIITGEKPVDDWDEFVELWHEYGGAQMLEEANEYMDANN